MYTLFYEKRADPRYASYKKISLAENGDQSHLAIIRNISRSGALISLIGSARTIRKDRLELTMGGCPRQCSLLHQEAGQLHCKFSQPIAEQDLSQCVQKERSLFPHTEKAFPVLPRFSGHRSRTSIARNQPTIPIIDRHPDKYVEGWSVGISQLDLADQALNDVVAVISRDLLLKDRELWLAGFRDAVQHNRRIATLPE